MNKWNMKSKAALIVNVGERLEFSRCRFSRNNELRLMSPDGECQWSGGGLLRHICLVSFVMVI
ncbi:hypothetical protein HanRHA438_Chr11g0526211 [Helianthus annuus]|nr:hypothetical protein HanRHA438_Chr11g0526211 [Helianthus annuus]